MTNQPPPPRVLTSGEYKVVYHVELTDLTYIPHDDPVWEDLARSIDNTSTTTADHTRGEDIATGVVSLEQWFDEEWSSTVIRSVIDNLPMYDELRGAHVYLGHWTANPEGAGTSGQQVAILGCDMETFGGDITYTGWRVTATANEVTWGVE